MTATIMIPAKLSGSDFVALRVAWNVAQDASIVLPLQLSLDEITDLVRFLGKQLPDDFASTVLADLVERPETPINLLESLFESADIGLQVAICIRTDLSGYLLEKCLSSTVPDVIEHIVFNKAISISDCERLLTTPPGRAAENAIRRAIEIKRSPDRMK